MLRPIALALLLLTFLHFTVSLPCQQFQGGACVRCAPNLVLLNGTCVAKITGCLSYFNASACAECNSTLFTLSGSQCVLLNASCDNLLQANITLYELAAFGDYMQIPLSQINDDSGFVRCDRMLRNGQYHHFISQSSQSVYFVAYSQLQSWRNYEIIYEASGGGLLLCLINYDNASSALAIQSIVSIGRSQLVERCLSYTTSLECNYCQQGYHLDQGRCRRDIAGCINYYRDICLTCERFMLLVENRCLSDCGQLCDTGQIKFFQAQYS